MIFAWTAFACTVTTLFLVTTEMPVQLAMFAQMVLVNPVLQKIVTMETVARTILATPLLEYVKT